MHLFLVAILFLSFLVTTSKALVPSSDALVPSSFLLLLVALVTTSDGTCS